MMGERFLLFSFMMPLRKKKVVCNPSIGPRSMQFQTIANLQMMSDTDVIVGIHHTSDK